MFGAGTYYMLKLIAAGPKVIPPDDSPDIGHARYDKRPKRPLSAIDDDPGPGRGVEPDR
jgi:hypothetical protein